MATQSQIVYLYLKYFFVYVGWWLIPIIILFLLKRSLSKYPIDVVIYEKRGENIVKTNDVAGRFTKPVNCYKLKTWKDTIPIPQYDWVLQCMNKPTNIFEKMANMLSGKIGSITLFKYGSKQYKPIDVKMADGVRRKFKEVKDKNGQPIWITVYEPVNVKQSMNKINFDVIDWDDMNHMTQELRAIAMRRSPVQAFLEKYGGIIGLTIGFLALIIGGYYYKEMLLDAGQKVYQTQQQAAVQAPDGNINKDGGIPIIGDFFAPGT